MSLLRTTTYRACKVCHLSVDTASTYTRTSRQAGPSSSSVPDTRKRPDPSTSLRRYATHSSGGSESLQFPSHLRNPTPYDIFHLPRSASQSEIKNRYYDLVKILHPDRRPRSQDDATSSSGRAKGKSKASENPSEEKVDEEFRLVVKSYELLSHRQKRATFDKFGLGWDSSTKADANGYGTFKSASEREWSELQRRREFMSRGERMHQWWNTHDQTGWQRHGHSYSYTGEDQFFTSHNNNNHSPRYIPNSQFISVIILVTWGIAIFQFLRLSNQSKEILKLQDKKHLNAVQSLNEATSLAKSSQGKERFQNMRARAREARILDEIERQKEGNLHTRPRPVVEQTQQDIKLLPPPPSQESVHH
ncbi:unnamed protein product [Sympodiomycopsis kandeliae]